MRSVLAAVLLSLLAGGVATSQDEAPNPEMANAIASVESALALWTEAAPRTLELAKSAPETLGTITDASRARLTGDATATLGELQEKLVARRNDLLFGASAPAPDAPEDEPLTLEVYDVASIGVSPGDGADAVPVPGFHTYNYRPRGGLAGATLSFTDDSNRRLSRGIDLDKLRDLIDDRGRGSIEICEGNLIARVSAARHARIRALIAACRPVAERRIALDLATYRMPLALGRELESLTAPDGSLSPEGERRLDAALEAGEVSFIGLETRSVLDGEEFATWNGDMRRIADDAPVSSVVATGQRIHARPILEPGGRSVLLDLSVGLATPTSSSVLELAVARTATRARLAVGRTTLVGGTFAVGSGTACVLAVKPTVVGAACEGSVSLAAPPPKVVVLSERPLGALAPKVEAEVARLETLIPLIGKLRAVAGSDFRLELTDVRDLLVESLPRVAAPLGVYASGSYAFYPRTAGPISEDWNEPGLVEPDKLEQLVKNQSGGDVVWGEPASYELQRGSVIICQRRDVFERIDGVLARLRKDRGRGARLEADVYETSPAFVRQLQALASGPSVLGERALAKLDAETGHARLVSAALLLAPIGAAPVYAEEGREVVSSEAFERTGSLVEARAEQETASGVTVSARAVRAHPAGAIAISDLSVTATLERGGAAFAVSASPTTGKAVLLVVRLRAVSPRD
ncbi:MAG TPA: hypothetical protein VFF73_19575 [Planctomycetota bacterium]|nr:hypothetical protein [Planctomycetota bacterium]